MIKIPRTDKYQETIERAHRKGVPGDAYLCVCCGKLVPEPYKYFIREGNGGGWAVTEEEDDRDQAGSLGIQPVGSDCWRRFPALHPFGGKFSELPKDKG